MLRRSIRAALASAVLIALVPIHSHHAIAQGRVGLTDLGDLGGGSSYPAGINDNGQVTGYSSLPNTTTRAFLYTGGSLLNLGTLGGTYSSGAGINASGQVTGWSYSSTGAQHAFIYSGGSMRDLGTLGGAYSSGNGINASGQVVGTADVGGSPHAFLYSAGGMQDLGTLGGAYSWAYAINGNGQITGNAYLANGLSHAFLYSGGSMRDLGNLSGGFYSQGSAINASGQVAGWSDTAAGLNLPHAFLYSGGTMRDLGTLGGTRSIALGINDSGQVVGQSTTASGTSHAFLWNAGTLFDLNSVVPAGGELTDAVSINNYAQITGTRGGNHGYVLTLHPDWQGGNGAWSDGNHWNYGGFGVMAIAPGAPHDVVINPAGSATVLGATDASVRSLRIAGSSGQIVTLNLNGGSTTTSAGTTIDANGVLAGSGRLGGTLTINAGGRVNVGAGESMQFAGGAVSNSGAIRALGTAASPASLETGGALTNNAAGQINVQSANLSFLGGLTNAGQVNATFGVANISGSINNVTGGKIIVSNGAQASFFDRLVNNGELRVSAGGAANFFGLVSGAGAFTGTGQSRFEGGFSPGNSPALVTINTVTSFSSTSPILMELGGTTPGTGHDKIVFTNAVTLEGGDLDVVWYGGWTGSGGDVYDLFDWNGTLTGTFGHVFLPTLASDLAWNTANLYTTGEISIAAIPEPETYAMLVAGLGLLGFAARRRRRRR